MTLAQLIRSVMKINGWGFRDLEVNARRRGHVLAYSRFGQFATQEMLRLPSAKVLRAVAAGLDVELDTVRYACLRSLGWKVQAPCPIVGGCVVLTAEPLTPEELAEVRVAHENVITSITERRKREHSITAS